MKYKLFITLILFFVFGCSWGSLIDGSSNPEYSALDEALSSIAVMPPSNVSWVAEPKNQQFTVTVTWDSVPNAKEYEISVSGDLNQKATTEAAEYSFGVDLNTMKGGVFTASVSVKTVNIKGTSSVYSAPVAVSFGSDSAYNGKVEGQFKASRGTSSSIKLIYARAEGADRYYLERRRTGAPEEIAWEVIESGIVNSDQYASNYEYLDQSAVPGYRYDYRITPIDAGGIKGEGTVTQAGFILPQIEDIRAGHGGEGKYEGNKGLFCVSWKIQNVLLDYGDVPVSDTDLTAILESVTFEGRVSDKGIKLSGIQTPNFSDKWNTVADTLAGFSNYNDNVTINGFDPLADGSVKEDFTLADAAVYKRPEENLDLYKIYIVVDNAFRQEASFQFRPKYNIGGSEDSMPWSETATGYLVSPEDAQKATDVVIGEATVTGNSISFSWSGTTTTGVWGVYLKKEGEPTFTFVASASESFYTVTDLSAGSYALGVAALISGDDGEVPGIIYETDMIAVEAGSAEEGE